MPMSTKVGGVWETVTTPSVKVAGVWEEVTNGFVKVGGVWEEFYPGIQELTITNGVNFNLKTNAAFLALDKTKPINVYLEGTFYSNNNAFGALIVEDLSTWNSVHIYIDAAATITGKGGLGGSANSGLGGGGGNAVNVLIANTNTVLSITNNGLIRGGGGGGGAGSQTSWGDSGLQDCGKSCFVCVVVKTVYAGGGGGGGGCSSPSSTSAGGSGSASTDGCNSFSSGVAGGTGSTVIGTGGSRGFTYSRQDLGSTCSACNVRYGVSGANGGTYGAGGNSSSGAGGSAGTAINNTASFNWTNNGTVTGPVS